MIAVGVVGGQTLLGEKRMHGRCKGDIGADPDAVSEGDRRNVEKCAVIIDETALPHMDIHAVFAVKRREHGKPVSLRRRDQLFQGALFCLCPPHGNLIETVTAAHAVRMLFFDIPTCGIVELPLPSDPSH